MFTIEDKFIALSAKLEAVDACIATLLDGYLASYHGGESPDDSQEYRRASTLAFVATDCVAQANKLLWELEADCDAAIQSTRIDIAASVVINGSAKQSRTERKETATCSR